MLKPKIFSIILFFAGFHCIAQSKQIKEIAPVKKYSVKGKVMQVDPYCGGAEPPPEVIKQHQTPYAYPGKTFFLRKGNTNSAKEKIVLKFKADSSGNFSFELPPGTYIIIQELQVKKLNVKKFKKKYKTADEECLNTWWKKPYYILEIKDKDILNLDFIFTNSCFLPKDIPCLKYDGPWPA